MRAWPALTGRTVSPSPKPDRPIERTSAARAAPSSIDEYIEGFAPEVQAVLENIRLTIGRAAPGAQEVISYRMPAFRLHGALVYFAAFKNHIGLYPPVRGDARLVEAVAPYAGPKGNLQFPLDRPIPYALIERVTRLRVAQNLAKAAARGAAPRRSP